MTTQEKQLAAKLQTEPVYFVKEVLGNNLWEKQEEILNALLTNRVVAVRSCHGSGKSYLAAQAVLWFLYTHPNSIVITTAPTYRQVTEILWREIRQAFTKSRYPLGGEVKRTGIDISEKWFALGLSTDEPDKFQGYHATNLMAVVDEAPGVPQIIFEALNGILTGENDRLLMTGNPTSLEGDFYESFRKENVYKVHISYEDTPNIKAGKVVIPGLVTQEWVDQMKDEWGETNPVFQSRVLGNFPDQGADTLIPLIKIEQAVEKQVAKTDKEDTIIGVDVARFGTDKTVLVVRVGNRVESIDKFNMEDIMQTSGRVMSKLMLYNGAIAKVDEVGVGAGVVDRLRELKAKVNGINVGESAVDNEMFVNKRAEFYWTLRQKFIDGEISIPNDNDLVAQLANLKYKYTSKGQIQIESKEDMKKRGMKSPDVADALMLAFGDRDRAYMGLLELLKEKQKDELTQFSTAALIKRAAEEGTPIT